MPQEVQTTSPASQEGKLARNGAAQQQGQQAQQPSMIPPVDVFEDEHGITLLADMPGATRESLGVRIDGDSLIIEASVSSPGPENMELVYGEAPYGAYRRQFTLSRELDTSRIDARLKDGVLHLSIPKAEAAKPRRIQVNVA